jgi:hypothetical protein
MAVPTLIISNPPHAERLNLAAAAPLLDLQPEELRPKVMYPVPEIWLAEAKEAQSKGYARALVLAGLRLVVVDASALVAIPARTLVTKFAFGPSALECQTAGGPVRLLYEQRLLGVLCTVREPDTTPAFFDVYAQGAGGIQRLTFEQGSTDLRGLLAERRIGVVANLPTLIATAEKRFRNLTADRRLMNMRLRKRTGLPAELVEKRRGFSFATAQLGDLLESVQTGLSEITQTELSSRLVLLTYVGETP